MSDLRRRSPLFQEVQDRSLDRAISPRLPPAAFSHDAPPPPAPSPDTHGEPDPAPSPVDIVYERARRVVQDCTDHSVSHLASLRDELDAVMRAIQANHDRLVDELADHAALSTAAVEVKEVVLHGMQNLRAQVEATGQKLPPSVTQQGGKK